MKTTYLRETLDESTLSFSSRKLPANSVWMEHLKLKNVLVCNPESRNIHNKIFGGWLMRQAFELGKFKWVIPWESIDCIIWVKLIRKELGVNLTMRE